MGGVEIEYRLFFIPFEVSRGNRNRSFHTGRIHKKIFPAHRFKGKLETGGAGFKCNDRIVGGIHFQKDADLMTGSDGLPSDLAVAY
jgi:hypothetical protein